MNQFTFNSIPSAQPQPSPIMKLSSPSLAGLRNVLATFLLAVLSVTGLQAAADSNPPDTLTYQGFVTDSSGVPFANTTPSNVVVYFRIYTASTGGTLKWSEQQVVTVDKGYFSVLLSEGTAISGETNRPALNTVFSGTDASDRYIGITVTNINAVEIAPRLRLLPGPYSFLARNANNLVNSSGASLIAPNASGGLNISGALQSTGGAFPGNARGANATDLQTARLSATQVASGAQSVIVGGRYNTASGFNAVVVGGEINRATGTGSFIGGGTNNFAAGDNSSVVGGLSNNTAAVAAFIGGGGSNAANGTFASVVGGAFNSANGNRAFVGGGHSNTASGQFAMVLGGTNNTASGDFSFASGRRAKAPVQGSFVWADSTDADFVSSAQDQFLMRAAGGVGINTTNTSGSALSVAGVVNVSSNLIVGGSVQSAGGNARGVFAVDLQAARTSVVQVASGSYSVLGGGRENTASGPYSLIGSGWGNSVASSAAVVSGGYLNTNSAGADDSVIAGGRENRTTGMRSVVGGGATNLASGINSVVAGGYTNTASGSYSTVSGGSRNRATGNSSTVGGGFTNLASGSTATISGGMQNSATAGFSTVGGGLTNAASGDYSVVAGGTDNIASGDYSTVAGGVHNVASGQSSFAAGQRAVAAHLGSFVWSDDASNEDFSSINQNSFNLRSRGGFYFLTSGVDFGDPARKGAFMVPGASSWSAYSDRNMKKNFAPVDGKDVLQKLDEVPLYKWNYKGDADTDTPHIGPVAQDFKPAFYPGRDDKGISTLEFDGVELAAIKGLHQLVKEKDTEIQSLKKEMQEMRAMVEALAKNKAGNAQ